MWVRTSNKGIEMRTAFRKCANPKNPRQAQLLLGDYVYSGCVPKRCNLARFGGKTMMRLIQLAVVGITLTCSTETLVAGITSYGHIYLYSTGLDSNLEANSAYAPVQRDFEGGVSVYGSDSITSYGYGCSPDGVGLATFTSSAFLRSDSGDLGIYVEGTGDGGWAYSPAGGGDAYVGWTDSVSLSWKGSGDPTALLNSDLVFHFTLEGALTTSINGITGFSSSVQSDASISARFNNELLSFDVGKNAVFNPTGEDQTICAAFDPTVSLNNGYASYTYLLRATAESSYGFGRADFANTMTLDSITFADGSTPESHGYELVFESGIQSPNVTAVPEPSSFAIFGIGACIVSAGAARRRRRECSRKQTA